MKIQSPVAAMVIGSVVNTVYMALFIGKPNAIAVYIFSVFIGIAGALIWTGTILNQFFNIIMIITMKFPMNFKFWKSKIIPKKVGQGTILITNSNNKTIGRNTGIFFCMFESSLLIGNIFIYFTFNGEKYIEDHTRTIVFAALTAVSVLGTITLFGIRSWVCTKTFSPSLLKNNY